MRETETVSMPVTLAEWVNADHCPLDALYEAGRLFVELRERTPEDPRLAARLAPLKTKLGTDVQWAGADEGGNVAALARIEVDADSILCLWRPWLKREGSAHPDDRRALDNWWDSRREAMGWGTYSDIPHFDRKYYSSLDSMVTQWYDTPETERPKRFPLDPVVRAWTEGGPVPNAGTQPAAEISLQDYLPHWQRYRQDVRQALEKDADETNGQDAHHAIERAFAPDMLVGLRNELRTTEDRVGLLVGLLPTENQVNLLVGLLRAADCEKHAGDCPLEEQATEFIKALIARLGTLGDLDHSRIERAFASGGTNYHDLRNMYRNQRAKADGGGLTLPSATR